ncbi:hypothetical protein J437_LFUL011077 [Ladona fulva]|uniref:CHK kinase-like domain-containing protein n=1 Tax=Ladona fulva TaxID=123851 RepID=A0A8K0KAF6_LADFU|nr:hypothetical protein J437_LFUL011077 [Ladona fulva]
MDSVLVPLLLRALEKCLGVEGVCLCGEPDVTRATPGVQGFLSVVQRVKVHYRVGDKEGRKILVLKRFPLSEMLVEFSRRSGIFVREGLFFDSVVPLMKKSVPRLPLPECYLASYAGSSDAIFMEDLSEGGFRTPEAKFLTEGMDWSHCCITMEKLGVLHGAAIAAEKALYQATGTGWAQAFPVFSQEVCYYETVPGVPPSPLTGVFQNAIRTIIELSKEIEGIPKEILTDKLEVALAGLWPMLCKLVRPDPEGCNILNHGDCWMNNIMFSYDEKGQPLDAKFIDFQVSRYCHPSIDILYFMHLSTTKSLRDSHLDELLQVYHHSLMKTLGSAAKEPISLDQLRADIKEDYGKFGVIIGAIMIPFFMLGKDFMGEAPSEETVDELLKTGNAESIRERFHSDKLFRSRMEEVILELFQMLFPKDK